MKLEKYIIHIKKAITIAVPIVIGQAGSQLAHVANTIMVGNVSSLHLAASTLANYTYLVPMLLGMGFTNAITPLVGNANGQNDLKECKNIFSNSFFIQLFNGIVLTILVLLLGMAIPLLDSDIVKTNLAQSYYNYLALSTFPLMLIGCFKSYFDGFGFTIYGMIAILLGDVINIFLNWVLIYGNLGFPALALNGAGIATLISRCLAAVFIIIISVSHPRLNKTIELPKLSKIAKEKVKEIYKVGFNIGIQSSVEIAAFSIIIIFAGWIGTTEVAAYQIAISISNIAYLSIIGIGTASTVLISNYNGNKNVRNIIDGSFSMAMIATVFMGICTILLVAMRFVLPPMFVHEKDVIELAPMLLLIIALFQIPDGLSVTFTGVLRGLLDTKVPMIIGLVSFWGLMVPAAYILAFKLNYGIMGLMGSVVASIFISFLLMFIRYRIVLRRQIKTLTTKIVNHNNLVG